MHITAEAGKKLVCMHQICSIISRIIIITIIANNFCKPQSHLPIPQIVSSESDKMNQHYLQTWVTYEPHNTYESALSTVFFGSRAIFSLSAIAIWLINNNSSNNVK